MIRMSDYLIKKRLWFSAAFPPIKPFVNVARGCYAPLVFSSEASAVSHTDSDGCLIRNKHGPKFCNNFCLICCKWFNFHVSFSFKLGGIVQRR